MTSADIDHAACDYCGLPLSMVGQSDGSPQYCCIGCRFAASVAQEGGQSGQIRWTLTKLGVSIFFTMNVMVFTMALWSRDLYGNDDGGQAELLYQLFRYLCLIFAVPVLLMLGGPLLETSWAHLRHGRLTTDLLLILGVAASFVYSIAAVVRGNGHVYFEVGCMVLVAVTLGRWLEATGKLKTTEALQALDRLLPREVRLVRGTAEENVAIDRVEPGEHVRVLASERIPIDGVIIRNQALVDEQVLTGESQPALKQTGDRVLGGTVNLDGDLTIEVVSRVDQGTLRRLMEAVRHAAAVKGHYQRLADRIASWFLPAVFVVALATFSFHLWYSGFQAALLASLAVVLIACPCALGLATPMAIWAAMGRASQEQVLFRSGDALSRLATVKGMCFDKTGTLTTGQPSVAEFSVDDPVHLEEVAAAADALASASVHGLSYSIRQFIRQKLADSNSTPVRVADARNLAGRGVAAHRDDSGIEMFLGSPRLMEESDLTCEPTLKQKLADAIEQGHPVACIGWQGSVRGIFVFREQIRDEALPTLGQLRSAGFGLAILTGDNSLRAAVIADQLQIDLASGLLPDDKQAEIERMRARLGPIAMIGDGVNDAPAVATADVGIAMGCGTDVVRQTADICLLGNDLSRLPWTIDLAKKTVSTIRQNLFWAFAYNTVGILLAATGWLNPIFAAVAMAASSFWVISNSLRLTNNGSDASQISPP